MTGYRGRFRTEQILEVACPVCAAAPGRFCDRKGDRLSRQGKALAASGTPPSHTERMWLRQGHAEDEFPALRAGIKPGNYPAKGRDRRERELWPEDLAHMRTPPKPGTARASGYGI